MNEFNKEDLFDALLKMLVVVVLFIIASLINATEIY